MERGNLVVGVHGDDLMVRVAPEETSKVTAEPHVRPFDITGRPMRGWVLVEAEGVSEDDALEAWVARSRAFVKTLPAK